MPKFIGKYKEVNSLVTVMIHAIDSCWTPRENQSDLGSSFELLSVEIHFKLYSKD